MKLHIKRSSTLLTVIVFAFGVVLTACGGSDTGAEGSEGGEDGGLGSLKVAATAKYAITELGAPIAQAEGLWSKRGLQIEDIASTENTTAALASGDADIVIGSPGRLTGGLMKGLDAVILGPTSDSFLEVWLVGNDSDVESVKELRGKKLGVTSFGSAGALAGQLAAEKYGWSEDELNLVSLGSLNGLVAGLKNGNIDAFAWPPLSPFTLAEQGKGRLIGEDFPESIGEVPIDVIVAKPSVVEERPQAVKAFCEGYYEGQKMLQDDISVGREVLVNGADLKPSDGLDRALKFGAPRLSTDSDMSEKMIEQIVQASKVSVEGTEDLTVDVIKDHYRSCSSL